MAHARHYDAYCLAHNADCLPVSVLFYGIVWVYIAATLVGDLLAPYSDAVADDKTYSDDHNSLIYNVQKSSGTFAVA